MVGEHTFVLCCASWSRATANLRCSPSSVSRVEHRLPCTAAAWRRPSSQVLARQIQVKDVRCTRFREARRFQSERGMGWLRSPFAFRRRCYTGCFERAGSPTLTRLNATMPACLQRHGTPADAACAASRRGAVAEVRTRLPSRTVQRPLYNVHWSVNSITMHRASRGLVVSRQVH